MSLKSACKFLFPGQFFKIIDKVEDAYNESDNRNKRKLYLEIKKDFEHIKNEKKNNTCKNNSKNSKKINLIKLLIEVLEYDIVLDKSTSVEIYHKLDSIEKEVKDLNISINSIDKGEKLLNKKIKQIYKRIEFITDVNSLIKNTEHKVALNKIDERRGKEKLNSLRTRLAKLSGGSKTRKIRNSR